MQFSKAYKESRSSEGGGIS